MEINILDIRPAGYVYLQEKLELASMPHWHTSFVSPTGTHRSKVQDGVIEDIYESVDLIAFLFDVEVNGKFYRRHMVDIPRIKFFI